jgi:hypothetical protein
MSALYSADDFELKVLTLQAAETGRKTGFEFASRLTKMRPLTVVEPEPCSVLSGARVSTNGPPELLTLMRNSLGRF